MHKIERKGTPIFVSWPLVSLLSLPIAQIFEDIVIFRLGPVYFTPIKFAILIGGLSLVKYMHPVNFYKHRVFSPVLLFFALFLLIQLVSISYADNLNISRKLNYFLFNTGILVITLVLSMAMLTQGYTRYLFKFATIIKVIFYSSLSFATLQLVVGDQIIKNVGNFRLDNQSIYVIHTVGFNVERLFLCEFITIGLAIILATGKQSAIKKLMLSCWSFIIVYSTGSFSGLIGFALVIFALKGNILKKAFYLMVVLLIFGLLVPILKDYVLEESKVKIGESRLEHYFVNYQEGNWRFFSSLILINKVISSPKILGEGYKSNEYFLSGAWDAYTFTKHGKIAGEVKPSSTHTFISIIYDQGILGFAIFTLFVISGVIICLRILASTHLSSSTELFLLSRMSVILLGLMLVRFLVYYHSIPRWYFPIAVVLLNTVYFAAKYYKDNIKLKDGTHYRHAAA